MTIDGVGQLGQAVQVLDELALGVGLEEDRLEPQLARPAADLPLQLVEREAAVDRGVAALEDVEVDAVQDGDAVVGALRLIASELLHGGADPIRIDQLPVAGLARLGEQDEADARGGPLLVALQGVEHRVDLDRRVEGDRQAVAAQDLLDLVAQLRRVGEPQRRQQAEADRLAVAVARVAARRLDRVADRVAEVEDAARRRRS